MMSNQRPGVTMVSTQNPMTAQGLMTSQPQVMMTQSGMVTSQPGMITSQQNLMTSQQNMQNQQPIKIRVNLPNQNAMTTMSNQPVSMQTDVSQALVSQPAMSMPTQQGMNQSFMAGGQQGAQQIVMQGAGSAPAMGGQVFPGAPDGGVADPTKAAVQNSKKIIWKGKVNDDYNPFVMHISPHIMYA